MKGLFRIPTDDNDVPLFTDSQWANEKVRRWIRDVVYRYEKRTAMDAGGASVVKDDSIAN